jgi:hypothetical protein
LHQRSQLARLGAWLRFSLAGLLGAGLAGKLSFPLFVDFINLWTELCDPEDFDRTAFHDAMNSTIVTFFKQALSDCVEN